MLHLEIFQSRTPDRLYRNGKPLRKYPGKFFFILYLIELKSVSGGNRKAEASSFFQKLSPSLHAHSDDRIHLCLSIRSVQLIQPVVREQQQCMMWGSLA